MKTRLQKPGAQGADSPKEFLQMLQSNRGTWVTEEEAAEWRTFVLESLAYPPKLELPVALTWLGVALAGVVILAIAVARWMDDKLESAVDFLGAAILFMLVGVYFFVGNYRACREQRLKPTQERLNEVEELYRCDLISEPELLELRNAITGGASK